MTTVVSLTREIDPASLEALLVPGAALSIDKPLAERILRDCPYAQQRPLNEDRALLLGDAMEHGTFLRLTQISFGRLHGRYHLVNGQHRLTAVTLADQPQAFRIEVYDCRDTAELHALYCRFDQPGGTRTLAQVSRSLGLHDELGGLRPATAALLLRTVPLLMIDLRRIAPAQRPRAARDLERRKEAALAWKPWAIDYQACLELQRETIAAFVVEADDLRAELMLIDENLCRAELGPAERAASLRRRKAIYLELYPQTRNGSTAGKQPDEAGRLESSQIENSGPDRLTLQVSQIEKPGPDRFAKASAEATGIAESTIHRDIARAEQLGDDTLARVAGTSLDKGVELDALAKLPPEQRAAVVERAAAGEKVSARPAKDTAPPAPGAAPAAAPALAVDNVVGRHELDLRRLRKLWSEVCPSAREAFRDEIAAAVSGAEASR
jgi:hypothetical protein